MNELLQQWLDARLLVPGMIACGVATREAVGARRSADANFHPDIMAQVFALLQNAGAVPGAEPPEVRWHTWVFANGKIRCATRPDGWTFAAAVRANSDAAQILDPLTEEFLSLKEGA
jgi:hypothetical protein